MGGNSAMSKCWGGKGGKVHTYMYNAMYECMHYNIIIVMTRVSYKQEQTKFLEGNQFLDICSPLPSCNKPCMYLYITVT